MGIVTSCKRAHFDLIHSKTEVLKFFDFVLAREDYFNSKPGISIKSNIFEDQTKLYYLFNSGTLLTFDKNSYEYLNNYILEDLNILSSLGVFNAITGPSSKTVSYTHLRAHETDS